jgi:hypothetical protein
VFCEIADGDKSVGGHTKADSSRGHRPVVAR